MVLRSLTVAARFTHFTSACFFPRQMLSTGVGPALALGARSPIGGFDLMRLVVNQSTCLGPRTGIGHYVAELLRRLPGLTDAAIDGFPRGLLLRAGRASAALSNSLRSPTPSSGAPLAPALRGRILNQFRHWGRAAFATYFRQTCTRRHYDLYHEPNFIPLPSDLPTVATLHDLSVLLHPEWHPADRVAYFERQFHRGLQRCQHFLAISEWARQEIIRTLGIPPDRITRTYMGIRPGLGPLPPEQVAVELRQLGLPPQYLLYLGTIEPRKNLLRLLRAYCALPASIRNQWPLLLVGGWGWNTGEVADYLHREARHRGVIHLGYVADAHLATLYNGARALVFPSLYEGFGLPPVEMMACGGAVLASTAGAVRETVGVRAHLIVPEDEDGWRTAMARVVQDDDWWRTLRLGVRNVAQPFTWEACAAETLKVYQKNMLAQAQVACGIATA